MAKKRKAPVVIELDDDTAPTARAEKAIRVFLHFIEAIMEDDDDMLAAFSFAEMREISQSGLDSLTTCRVTINQAKVTADKAVGLARSAASELLAIKDEMNRLAPINPMAHIPQRMAAE
jgi:hypothetical protein